jgi:hypothetical protein
MYDIMCVPMTIVSGNATCEPGGDKFAGTPNTKVKVWVLNYDP